ncbi:MAG: hypothetical protein ABL957_07140 [Parvularculaceae bacterium]
MSHPLKTYLNETGDNVSAFARRVGVAADALEEMLGNRQPPEPALARRIVLATGGAVSFDQLMSGRGAVIADLSVRLAADSSLDLTRLAGAIACAAADLPGADRIPSRDFDIAAEAAAHTYAALARLTPSEGRGRLVQALRPILAEILKDSGTLPQDLQALDAAALAAAEGYYSRH